MSKYQTKQPQSANKRVLHFCSYLINTGLFYNLFSSLQMAGIEQNVFVPMRKDSPWSWDPTQTAIDHVAINYQSPIDRIWYGNKIRKGLQQFSRPFRNLNPPPDLMHAHSVFSDGGLAYKFSKLNGLPYVLTLRSTDMHVFWSCMPHLRHFGKQILCHASRIVFLSEPYRQLASKRFSSFWEEISPRTTVVPNGIDSFWHNRVPEGRGSKDRTIRILYVGQFIRRKRIDHVIKTAEALLGNGVLVKLRLVGRQPNKPLPFKTPANAPWLEVFDHTASRAELATHFDWADVFLMPSRYEAFGLVYAEALSQGVPVIYLKNEGFDGWCRDATCGIGVSPGSISEMGKAVLALTEKSDSMECRNVANAFRWNDIASEYVDVYSDATK